MLQPVRRGISQRSNEEMHDRTKQLKFCLMYLYGNSGVNSMVEVEIRGVVVGPVRYPEIAVSYAAVQLFLHAALLQ